MKRSIFGVIFGTALFAVMQVAYAGQPIDDSSSEVLSPVVQMQWENPLAIPGRGSPNTSIGQTEVIVRLNTQNFVGKTGRIVIKSRHPADVQMRAQWVFRQNMLRSGMLRTGDETVVYQGLITQDMIEDRMTLRLAVEGGGRETHEKIDFYFEFEE